MKKEKRHPEWVFVRAYQKLFSYTDQYMASYLGISTRTYNDKVKGWGDFNKLECNALQRLFNVSGDALFFTINVSNRQQQNKSQ